MLFRSVLASAVAVAALLSTPVAARDAEALKAQVGAYVQPSNSERMNVLLGQLRAAGFTPTVETFDGGGRGGPMQGSNVVVTIGDGPKEILLTAHYDAVRLRDGAMSQGVIDNAGSVVALIEAAKILRDSGRGQKRGGGDSGRENGSKQHEGPLPCPSPGASGPA